VGGTESEILVVFSVIVFTAAFDAGGFSAQGFHSSQHSIAGWTRVEELSRLALPFEWQFMTALFVRNSKILAGLAPFRSVGLDPSPPHAVLGEKVSEFVTQCALNFHRGNFHELGIQHDHPFTPISHSGCRAERGIPKDACLQFSAARGLQKLVCKILQKRIIAQTRISSRLLNVIRLCTNATHHRASEIQ
jgi:hypothetical protein